MIDTGDIYLADFGQEIRRTLVVSNGRFTAASGRAMVVPQFLGLVEQVHRGHALCRRSTPQCRH